VTWLLTGGAGYIGSHIVLAFQDAGKEVVVLDDLSSGYRAFVPDEVAFVEGTITDPVVVAKTLDDHKITGVVHLAGYKYAGESVNRPLHTYEQNVVGMRILLEALMQRSIHNFVFSSSSSCYATPKVEVVTEDAEDVRPESPYGESKLIGEWMLRDLNTAVPELRQTSLRYFNVVGSGPPHLADHSPFNLFPRVLKALTSGETPAIFGTDYATPDGTAIRDYIHVSDLAEAHVLAASRFDDGLPCEGIYNVGRGEGVSVRQIMDAMQRNTGIEFEPRLEARRPGDPARIIGSSARIEKDFGWKASRDLDDMVASAWAAWQHQVEMFGGPPEN
jgi:UDP-glucose 4-epimerase